MKILIVDDEFNARRIIRKLLTEKFEGLNFLNDASSVEEAIELIRDESPDIVFLDIQLGNKKSFEIFDKTSIQGEFIFVTAYDQYTREAFDLEAVNYIMKPVQRNKLYSAFERAKMLVKASNSISEINHSETKMNKILLPNSGKQTVINVDDIIYAKADGVYCRIFFKNNVSSIIAKPLVFLEDKLNEYPCIMRIHKSYLVNLKEVKNVASNLSHLYINSTEMLPVSRQKKQELKKMLEDFFY
ncbi:MAG: LytTR family DNA-binding domain-containing protein [Crocinitomicaceae bacterium]|nr:LytTR family DNA-binding domain-containing protein [Crocinitomicaceae bacterium]